MTAIIWFRRDLRLHDHAALHTAALTGEPIVPLFIMDDAFCQPDAVADKRLHAFLSAVDNLAGSLQEAGGRLLIRRGNPADVLCQVARETGADKVFYNRAYTPEARKRDANVTKALERQGMYVHACKDLLMHEPGDILTKQRTPYAVFTPYKRVWLTLPKDRPFPQPRLWHMYADLAELAGEPVPVVEAFGRKRPVGEEWATALYGERAARERLKQFMHEAVHRYKERRDFPGLDATSHLSFALNAGTLSIRTVYHQALEAMEEARGEEVASVEAFVTELVWREFYYQVLYHHPHTADHAYLPQFEAVAWENDEALFSAWCNGETGYPIVDAAMKQLNETGWMHNRLRMIAASFLTKDLLVDWRWGMRYFAKQLVDFDEAANIGGWQWSASTGTDPQPYFRIFNPVAQGEKFDPDGTFVKKYLPVLSEVPLQYIHKPWEMPEHVQEQAGCRLGLDYPVPCVDHASRRKLAMSLFQEAKDSYARTRK
ncbi:deoxyribodipyrimidine photo-lyase [Brevibacillus parabrevis]|uniref:cryptochrome/photolyase family protein n=1 Tax=Brevibacillus parabrevis TaxID=54914 RepID=UPI002E251C55|nr:deoxyribodipyrimidine photo-lyase [Brevibacillus parabrevis]